MPTYKVKLLSNNEIKSLLTAEAGDNTDLNRGLVLCTLYHLGFGLQDVFGLALSAIKPNLGYIYYDNRVYPLSPIHRKNIERWLEVRPQKGRLQHVFITSDYGTPYVALRKASHIFLSAWGNHAIGRSVSLTEIRFRSMAEHIVSFSFQAGLSAQQIAQKFNIEVDHVYFHKADLIRRDVFREIIPLE